MESNYNFSDKYLEENWRELPDELPSLLSSSSSSIPLASLSDYELDLTYRSIRAPESHDFINFESNITDISTIKGDHLSTSTKPRIEYSNLQAPVIPFYIGFSHFSLRMSLNELVISVHNCLDQIIELDYSFLDTSCKWDIVYLRGSSFCHFEISVFDENTSPEKYLLEGNRLSGDSLSFKLIFNQIKDVLTSTKYVQLSPVSPYLHLLPVPSPAAPQRPKLSSRSYNIPSEFSTRPTLFQFSAEGSTVDDDEQVKKNLQPILAMIDPGSSLDIQLEGIRILCDFTMTIDLHRLLVECNCVEKLIELLTSDTTATAAGKTEVLDEETCCHQYALYAIANMSTFRPCQNILVSSDKFLSYLMNQITNGTHITAEMRRECARTLANLCVGLAPKIVRNLGLTAAMTWVDTVDSLSDERLKIHATRAKMYIQNCF